MNSIKDKYPSESVIEKLSIETGLKINDIKKWYKIRNLLNKPSKLKKFNESSWRFVYYLSLWTYGLIILYEVFDFIFYL